jgi:hypothetical protein
MLERRRQAASPVSLLVVTLLFVWACSSGDHEDASVTTGGGSGSEIAAGSAAGTTRQGTDAPADGGIEEPDPQAVVSRDAAGAGGVPSVVESLPAGGELSVPSGGANALPGSDADAGSAGSAAGSLGGAAHGVAGSAGSAGKASGSAGAPFVAPTCAPTIVSAAPDALYLPCDVNAAMYICRSCHSNPPTKPANTSYVTYADIKPRAAAIADMVRTGYMPRPPFNLSEAQKRTILTWLGQDGTCAVGVPTACQ